MPDEGGRHREHETEHEGDQDQDLGDEDPDLEFLDPVRAGQIHQPREAERDQQDRHDRQAREDPHDAPPDELAHGQASDDDHASVDPVIQLEEARLEQPRPGSTAWTRPPAATMAATRSGIRAGSRGRIVGQSSSTVREPNLATAACPPLSSSVAREPDAVDRHDIVERARGIPAVVEDDHPIADTLDLGQQVGVEDDRGAAIAGRADDGADVRPADGIERRGRFIEQDQLRFAEQGDPQPEALLHALREPTDRVPGAIREPDPVQRLIDGGSAAPTAGCASSACRARTSRAVSHGWKRNSSGR